jgi:hypothetical protein
MRIAYFYLMRDEPDRVRAVAPAHAAYWGWASPSRVRRWTAGRSVRRADHIRV